jgi:hypothetical protein
MSFRILLSNTHKVVMNNGRPIVVKWATETDSWRQAFIAPQVLEDFSKSVETADIPARATVAVMTYVNRSGCVKHVLTIDTVRRNIRVPVTPAVTSPSPGKTLKETM